MHNFFEPVEDAPSIFACGYGPKISAELILTSPQQAASCHCTEEVPMSHLSPPTLTHTEQKAILRATVRNPRDHLIYSLALGTGLRLAEIVGLDVGDAYIEDKIPRTRIRIRPEIAKGGRKGRRFPARRAHA